MWHWLASKRARDPARAYREGDSARAARLCRARLERAPGDVEALTLLAAIAADAGRIEEGLQWAERAAAADPAGASPAYVKGRLLQDAGRLAEAEASYRRVLEADRAHARALNNLGCVLQMQGRLDEALDAFRQALALDPSLPQANQNAAAIQRDPETLRRAVTALQAQTAAHPHDARAFNDLGNALRELGRHDEALESYARAIALKPDLAEAHFSRAFVLLLLGDYETGWKDYEWRWRIPAFNAPARRFELPMWRGAPLGAGTLLMHAEQGLGDTLQFVRYASLAAQRCGEVVLECQPELRALLEATPGLARVVPRGEPLGHFDAHVPLMSLPAAFGTTLETIPWDGPYVLADVARAAVWRKELDAVSPGLRVGIVWGGRPEQWDDRKRSLPLAQLTPLARVEGATFVSLQKGAPAAQAASPPAGMRLLDVSARLRDFSDTAALVAALDLVITIDTSVAHLAGAMGVPIWVLVAHVPDWRYHAGREDNPWYPTMRLFRQTRDADWSGPVEAAAAALAADGGELLARRRGR